MGSYASSEAVAFSQSLFNQTPAHVGYLKGLREAGPVDLGYVAYPEANGSRQGWVLVNGNPAIVDVDSLNLLPHAVLEDDQHFKDLQTQYPHIALSVENDDRSAESVPEMVALGDGSQRFVITYSLKEPCTTCPTVARAAFGFDFDPTGKFLGARFLKVSTVNR
jgi:hypothetical protein